MGAQHTPGPWFSQRGISAGREVIAPEAPKAKRIVARCGGPDREANAQLIASAAGMRGAIWTAIGEICALVQDPEKPDFSAACPNTADAECLAKALWVLRAAHLDATEA